MKRLVLFFVLLCGSAFNAHADVCYDISKDIADKVILQKMGISIWLIPILI